MTFATAHKAATYAMVAAAMLAMVGGGGVSTPWAAAGVLGLIVSWWWEPPRVDLDRWAPWWTGASVLVLLYSIVSAIATADYLGIGAQFLLWLVLAKAFGRRTLRDWQQLHLLSLLMLVAGSVLNIDLAYGVAFLAFVIAATWALILFHLRREADASLAWRAGGGAAELARVLGSRRIVSGRFFAGTAAVSMVIFLVSAAIFLALPRVGAGFFMKGRAGRSMAGFSDGVKLGGHGTIKTDASVVLRAIVPPAYQGRSAPQLHWRGVAFDRYRRGEWTRTAAAPMSIYDVDYPAAHRERRRLALHGRSSRGLSFDDLAASLDRVDVWLEPMDTDALFGPGIPRMFEVPRPASRFRGKIERNDEVRVDHNATIQYTVWAELGAPDPEVLRAARGPLPPGYDAFLEVPDEITERTRALAREITAGATNAYDQAEALRTWLARELRYTVEQRDPGGQEPIDYFLFDRRAGHCEYFASAFAIMARTLGLATRNVAGFLGGEWNEYDGYVAVRAGDAHAWVEVFFPDVGWVIFDPTPSGQDALGRGSDGVLARLGRFLDTLRFQWTRWVIDYDLGAQLELFRDVGGAIKGGARDVREAVAATWRWVKDHAIAAAALALALALVIAWRWRRVRLRGPHGATPGARRRRSGVARAYLDARAALARRGIGLDAAQTPRELALARAAAAAEEAAALGELTDLYYRVEHGGEPEAPIATRAALLRAQVVTAGRK